MFVHVANLAGSRSQLSTLSPRSSPLQLTLGLVIACLLLLLLLLRRVRII
jgi:hypothetical protein